MGYQNRSYKDGSAIKETEIFVFKRYDNGGRYCGDFNIMYTAITKKGTVLLKTVPVQWDCISVSLCLFLNQQIQLNHYYQLIFHC